MGRRDKTTPDKDAEELSPGERMRHARQQKGISLTELSRRLQYSKSYLSMVETGATRPSMELVEQYEQELELRQGELMDRFNEVVRVGDGLAQDEPALSVPTDSEAISSSGTSLQSEPTAIPETKGRERARKVPFDEALLLEPPNFVGRDEDLMWVLERLRSGGMAAIAALRGLGGIGKTSLAAIAIRRLREERCFPDGIAVVLCQDLNEAPNVLHHILSRFDPHHRESETSDFADLSEIAYRLLHGKKVLIVLDNVQPELAIEQVIAPLHAARASLLLTSRHVLPLTVMPVDATRKLDLLSDEEALELFTRSLGREGTAHLSASERLAAERIVRVLDRHTLAVKLSGANALILHRDLEALADELENPLGAFELFEDDVPHAVRRVFSRSLDALPEVARQLFAGLAAFASTDFGRQAVIALAGGLDLPISALNILMWRSLVDGFFNYEMPKKISNYERLRLHPLLRTLAMTEFERWSEERRQLAYAVLARYYTDYTNRLFNAIPDQEEMTAAFDPDVTNIHSSLEWAYAHQRHDLVMSICAGMQYLWSNRWLTDASLRYLPWGIEAARTISEAIHEPADRLCFARLSLSYGDTLQLTSGTGTNKSRAGLESAQFYYEQSLTIARQLHDRQIEGVTLHQFGRLVRKLGDLERAEQLYEQALPILREIHNRREEGWTLAFLGQIRHDRGDLQEAERLYKDALAIHHQTGHRRGEGWIIGYLGQLALTYGRLAEARKYYEQSLALAEQLQDRRSKGVCLSFLGEIALAEKEYDQAWQCLQEALHILGTVHDLQSEGWLLNLLGQVALAQGAYAEARELLENALGKLQATNDLRGECRVRTYLAQISELQGDLDSCEQYYRQSFTLCQKIQDIRVVVNTYLELGRFLIERRDKRGEGCALLTSMLQLFHDRTWPGKEEVWDHAQKLLQVCQ